MEIESFKTLLGTSEDFFLVCIDKNGNYTYVNDGFAKRFKHIANNFIGKNCLPTIHPDDHKLLFDTVSQCYAHPQTCIPITLHKPTENGIYTTTKWNFIAITDDHNIPQSILCIGFEITAFISQIDLDKEVIKDLSNIHSHEVRKPLANILGLINLLDLSQMSETDRLAIQLIKTSVLEFDEVLKRLANRM